MKPSIHTQNIHLDLSYPVFFDRNVFTSGHGFLGEVFKSLDASCHNRKVLLVVDEGLTRACPSFLNDVEAFWKQSQGLPAWTGNPLVVPGGEAIKNDYRKLMEVVDVMLEHRLCRHSFVLIIGGGAVLDAVGFAASIVHRGLRTVRMPSTTLAQNDAGVGVKTGMNLHGGKNTIGTFHVPSAVINDAALLSSLSDEDWRAGISEAFKVAMIKDAAFFTWLCENATRLRERDEEAMAYLVETCAILHLDHITSGGDPFETGSARPLDFGHWSAHKLEGMSGYELSHGYAVGIGLLIDSSYAMAKGWLDEASFEALYQGLANSGMSLWHRSLDQCRSDGLRQVVDGIEEFREHLGGELCLTFPQGLGATSEVNRIDLPVLTQCLNDLAARAARRMNAHATQF